MCSHRACRCDIGSRGAFVSRSRNYRHMPASALPAHNGACRAYLPCACFMHNQILLRKARFQNIVYRCSCIFVFASHVFRRDLFTIEIQHKQNAAYGVLYSRLLYSKKSYPLVFASQKMPFGGRIFRCDSFALRNF